MEKLSSLSHKKGYSNRVQHLKMAKRFMHQSSRYGEYQKSFIPEGLVCGNFSFRKSLRKEGKC